MHTFHSKDFSSSGSAVLSESDATLINLDAHRRDKSERFPDVDDLLERLTDNTVNVANGTHRAR